MQQSSGDVPNNLIKQSYHVQKSMHFVFWRIFGSGENWKETSNEDGKYISSITKAWWKYFDDYGQYYMNKYHQKILYIMPN